MKDKKDERIEQKIEALQRLNEALVEENELVKQAHKVVKGNNELLKQFTTAWLTIFTRIDSFRQSRGLEDVPLLFTEIGYTFRRYSTVEPWNHGGFTVVGWKGHRRKLVVWGEQPVDRQERELALRALLAAHREQPALLRGLLYWKLSTNKEHERIEPFVLHVGEDSLDPSMPVLAGFLNR